MLEQRWVEFWTAADQLTTNTCHSTERVRLRLSRGRPRLPLTAPAPTCALPICSAAQVVKADFEDPDSLAEAFRGCDAVFAVTGRLLFGGCSKAWRRGHAAERLYYYLLLPPALHVPSLTWRASMPPLSLPTIYLSLSDFWQSCQLDAEREKKQGSCTCCCLLPCLHWAAKDHSLL